MMKKIFPIIFYLLIFALMASCYVPVKDASSESFDAILETAQDENFTESDLENFSSDAISEALTYLTKVVCYYAMIFAGVALLLNLIHALTGFTFFGILCIIPDLLLLLFAIITLLSKEAIVVSLILTALALVILISNIGALKKR